MPPLSRPLRLFLALDGRRSGATSGDRDSCCGSDTRSASLESFVPEVFPAGPAPPKLAAATTRLGNGVLSVSGRVTEMETSGFLPSVGGDDQSHTDPNVAGRGEENVCVRAVPGRKGV